MINYRLTYRLSFRTTFTEFSFRSLISSCFYWSFKCPAFAFVQKVLTRHRNWSHYHNHLRELEDHMSTTSRRTGLRLGSSSSAKSSNHSEALQIEATEPSSEIKNFDVGVEINQTGGYLDACGTTSTNSHRKRILRDKWIGQKGSFRNCMWGAKAAA